MARYRQTIRFQKSLEKLSSETQNKVKAALRKFRQQKLPNSLRLEKLGGDDNVWSIRVDRGHRILLIRKSDQSGDYYALDYVGSHDVYQTIRKT